MHSSTDETLIETAAAGDSGPGTGAERPGADLAAAATAWLSRLRELYRPRGEPLSPAQRELLSRYFEDSLLDQVRVLVLARLSLIDDADLRGHLPPGTPAEALPIDLRRITGLTLVDTICIGRNGLPPDGNLLPTLFQELVHMLQFRRLGVHGFLRAYLEGWAAQGQRHESIPLERQALALRQRFEAAPSAPFSVLQELERHEH